MKKIIKITESDLRRIVLECAKRCLNEGVYDDSYDDGTPDTAQEDFYNGDYADEMERKYPDMEFEYDVDDNGNVRATDIKTGNYYTGNGEVNSETVGLGRPSSYDYDSEAEGTQYYYDYSNCMKEIMAKIDSGQPDGVDDIN